MAGKKLDYEINVDSSGGIKGIEKFGKAVRKELKAVEADLEDTRTAGQKMADALDSLAGQMEAELKGAAKAAEALGRALGPELAGRSDIGAVVTDLNRMGLTFEEITADADRLAQSLKNIEQVRVDATAAGFGDSINRARGGVDDLSDSARGANSALANMIGNTTQDLGAVAGVAGSAGVAIGQMAEYAADAVFDAESLSSALKSMAKVAGPIAVLGVATQALGEYINGINAEKAFKAELVEEFAAGLRDAKDSAQTLLETLETTGTLEFQRGGAGFFGFGQTAESVLEVLHKLNIDWERFQTIIADPASTHWIEQTITALETSGEATTENLGAWTDLLEIVEQYGGAAQAAAAEEKLRLEVLRGVNRQKGEERRRVDELTDAYNAEMAARLGIVDVADLETASVKESADAQESYVTRVIRAGIDHNRHLLNAAAAQAAFAQSVTDARKILEQPASIESAVTGMGKVYDQLFGLARIASASEAAFDALGQAVKDNGFTFDLNTEAGRANQQLLEQLAESQIPQIAAAYKEAGGNFGAFAREMDAIKLRLFAQLRDETELTDAQIREVINRLGAFDGKSYQATFEMLGLEDAETKLALLLPMLETLQLTPDIAREVAIAVQAGDPQAALAAIQRGINAAPDPYVAIQVKNPDPRAVREMLTWTQAQLDRRTLHLNAQVNLMKGVLLDQGGTAPPGGGIAAEKGPEIINDRYLAVGPTYVPPGTRVTSRKRTERILRTRGTRGLRRFDSGGVVPAGPVTINFNGVGAIGNNFDLSRTIDRGIRTRTRLIGTRR